MLNPIIGFHRSFKWLIHDVDRIAIKCSVFILDGKNIAVMAIVPGFPVTIHEIIVQTGVCKRQAGISFRSCFTVFHILQESYSVVGRRNHKSIHLQVSEFVLIASIRIAGIKETICKKQDFFSIRRKSGIVFMPFIIRYFYRRGSSIGLADVQVCIPLIGYDVEISN